MKANITITDEKLFADLSAIRGSKTWNAFLRELLEAKKEKTSAAIVTATRSKAEKIDVTTLFMQIYTAAKKEFHGKKIPLSYFTTISGKRAAETGKEPNAKVKAGVLIGNDFGAIHLDVVKKIVSELGIDLTSHIRGAKI